MHSHGQQTSNPVHSETRQKVKSGLATSCSSATVSYHMWWPWYTRTLPLSTLTATYNTWPHHPLLTFGEIDDIPYSTDRSQLCRGKKPHAVTQGTSWQLASKYRHHIMSEDTASAQPFSRIELSERESAVPPAVCPGNTSQKVVSCWPDQ